MGASPLGGMPSGCARANPLEINSYSQWSPLFPAFGTRWICWTCPSSYGEKTRPGRCPEPELIAQRPLMINQAREVFCQGRFPASLIHVLIVGPWPAVPSTFPFVVLSAGPPVVLDTALLPCSSVPPAAKETRSDCLCPDGCAPHGNVRYIAATLAAATILQTGSASTDILL